MRLEDFDYPLPPECIAQSSAEPRDSSRLLVLDRASGETQHMIFREIGNFLSPGDLLVFNDTRVIPARLNAHKLGTGGKKVELILMDRPMPEGPTGRLIWIRNFLAKNNVTQKEIIYFR